MLAGVRRRPRVQDPRYGIVIVDEAALRSAPRDSAKAHTASCGKAMPSRFAASSLDYLQVYDHRIERGGFLSAKHVRLLPADAPGADELLAVLRFLRDTPGQEASRHRICAAAYIRRRIAETLRGPKGAEVLDALGTFADRLARARRQAPRRRSPARRRSLAHLEVAMHYGVAVHDVRARVARSLSAMRATRSGVCSTCAPAEWRSAPARRSASPGLDVRAGRAASHGAGGADEARATLLNGIDVLELPT